MCPSFIGYFGYYSLAIPVRPSTKTKPIDTTRPGEKFWLNTKPTLLGETDSKWEKLGNQRQLTHDLVYLLLLLTIVFSD